VVHTLTPLGDVVSRARAAERFAKSADGSAGDDRNALAVLVDKRSGAPVRWRMQWPPPHKEDGPLPGGRLGRLAGLVEAGRMPHKLPYELERLRAQLDEVSDNDVSLARCIRFEVLRVLARKEPSDKVGGLTPKDVDLVLPADDDVTAGNLRDVLQEWVSAAKVAFTLADAGSATRTIRDRMKRLIEEGAR
jgi:hypothetical protein